MRRLIEEATKTLNEVNYFSSISKISETAKGISELPSSRLSMFFTDLYDEFQKIYDEDNRRTDAKTFAEELLKISKLARKTN